MFCNKCGKEIIEGKKFCSGCGAPVPGASASAPASTPSATPVAPVIPAAPAATPTVTPATTSAPKVEVPVAPAPKAMKQKAPIVKKSNKKVITIVGIVLVLALLLTGGIIIFKNIKAKRQEEVSKMLKKGDHYLEEMEFDEAISIYQEALELDDRNLDAYIGLANAYIGNRDYYSALDVLTKGLDRVKKDDVDEIEDLLEDVEEVIEMEAEFSGVVVAGDGDTVYGNNTPLEGVRVSIESVDMPEDYTYSDSTVTDENGYYEFKDLHLGNYVITFESDDYINVEERLEVYPGQEVANNTLVEMVSNEYSGNGGATGVIIDATTGAGIEGLTLQIRSGYNTVDGKVIETVTTTVGGSYEVSDIPAGVYTAKIVDNRRDVEERYTGGLMGIKILGGTVISNQNGSVSDDLNPGQIRIVMSWGQYPYDVDSHLWVQLHSGEQGHVYFINKDFRVEGVHIANLDLDDTSSYGPETTTVYEPQPGKYTFGVYNYWHGASDELLNSGAMVQVYLGNSYIPSYVYYVPQEEGYYWEVFSYDPETMRITTINKMYDSYSDGMYFE
ncbi:MAG: carboxypeptidase regulatory-like domain-containing protein [Saccharofermentans sp.]|nr:carboxypeptidase regulatory-like domain-containing protein [Saccharofermentans sp.]